MITIERSKRIVSYRQKWFSRNVCRRDALRLVVYNQSHVNGRRYGFKRQAVFTKLIGLTSTQDQLLSACGKNTRYKIKRARREGILFELEMNFERYIDYFNGFAVSKGLQTLDRAVTVRDYGDHVAVTKAVCAGEDLVMHCYLVDLDELRVRLLHSASLFRLEFDSQKRALIGRANRYLHYQDMLHFKSQGFITYDMGGYAQDTRDPVLVNINEFKDGFGGTLVEESRYVSLPLYWLSRAAGVIKLGVKDVRMGEVV